MNKKPWEEHSHIWPNQTSFFTYLRGCLRKAWNTNPVKISYSNSKKKQIKNPNPNGRKPTVFGFECECCQQEFPMKMGQVDHKTPAGSLSSEEDIQGFVERLLFVTYDDLQMLCKPCHAAYTHAERYGMTLNEAFADKEAIAFSKLPKAEKVEILTKNGIDASSLTNPKMRKKYYDLILYKQNSE